MKQGKIRITAVCIMVSMAMAFSGCADDQLPKTEPVDTTAYCTDDTSLSGTPTAGSSDTLTEVPSEDMITDTMVVPSGGSTTEPTAPPSGGSTTEPTAPPSGGSTTEPTAPPSSGSITKPAVPSSGGSTTEPTVTPSGGSTTKPTVPPSGGSTTKPTVPPSGGSTTKPTAPPSGGSTTEPTQPPSGNTQEPSPETHPADDAVSQEKRYFSLDIEAPETAAAGDIIDVVITIKGIECELDAVEFSLNFDPSKLEGVITESGSAMDAFMAVKPMYTFTVSGMELPASRYEQICRYDSDKGVYECRFIDLSRYANAKPGQVYAGLCHDGDLVIKIPFLVLDTASNHDLIFAMADGSVKGTTRGTLVTVCGTSDTASTKAE